MVKDMPDDCSVCDYFVLRHVVGQIDKDKNVVVGHQQILWCECVGPSGNQIKNLEPCKLFRLNPNLPV